MSEARLRGGPLHLSMKVYHATKNKKSYGAILKSGILLPGENVVTKETAVHLSLDPFSRGAYALDVIGEDTNTAWIFECEVPDDIKFENDPSMEGEIYKGRWVIHRGELPVKIITVRHISDVIEWEMTENPQEYEKIVFETKHQPPEGDMRRMNKH